MTAVIVSEIRQHLVDLLELNLEEKVGLWWDGSWETTGDDS